jgi:MFS transporter, DHA1 family, tetracycline resistance protein
LALGYPLNSFKTKLFMKKSPLLVLFLTIFIDLVGFGIVLPLLPNYARELGASPIIVGTIAATYSLMNFFFAPIWGSISDRIGRRPVILISVATSVVSYLIFSHSHTIAWLIFSRVLAGIGSANVSTAQAYITDVTDAANRSKSLGLVGAAFGLGFIFGPPIGGILKTHFGIQAVGYAAAGLSLIDLILAFFLLPESLKEKLNGKSALKFFKFGLIAKTLTQGPISRVAWINFLYIFAFVNMQVSVAMLAKEHYGLSDKLIGYLFAYIGFIAAMVQGGLIGRLTKKFGENKLLFIGTLLMMFGMLAIPFTPRSGSSSLPFGLLSLGLVAFGNGLIAPTNTALASMLTPQEVQGERLGVLQSIGSLARIAGPFTGGILYGVNYHAPYVLGACFLAASAYLAYCLFKAYSKS